MRGIKRVVVEETRVADNETPQLCGERKGGTCLYHGMWLLGLLLMSGKGIRNGELKGKGITEIERGEDAVMEANS